MVNRLLYIECVFFPLMKISIMFREYSTYLRYRQIWKGARWQTHICSRRQPEVNLGILVSAECTAGSEVRFRFPSAIGIRERSSDVVGGLVGAGATE